LARKPLPWLATPHRALPADRELFLKTLAHVVSRYRWICHAYCLMANHYHLLVETPKGQSFHWYAAAKRHIHPEFQPPP
jgi:REP element-mobilizing transposase RayT